MPRCGFLFDRQCSAARTFPRNPLFYKKILVTQSSKRQKTREKFTDYQSRQVR